MTQEAVCAGVDVAKNTLKVAVSGSEEARQFANVEDHLANIFAKLNVGSRTEAVVGGQPC